MNFKKLFMVTCILCSLLFIQGTALAATVHGTVYEWYSFEPLNNAVIEINSTPEQYFVAVDSVYSFSLPPGNYLVKASYFEGNNIVYAAEETIKITENGDYVVDLLLFPTYEEELLNQSEFEEFDQDFEEAELVTEESSGNTTYAALILALCVLLFTGYLWNKRKGKPSEIPDDSLKENERLSEMDPGNAGNDPENFEEFEEKAENFVSSSETNSEAPALQAVEEDTRKPAAELLEPEALSFNEEAFEDKTPETEASSEVESKEVLSESEVAVPSSLPQTPDKLEIEVQDDPEACLPDDLKDILELIRVSGNRITQLELRKKSRYSESKVSLMLSDLEERRMIEKFKKGRGNIIRIPDEHVLKRDDENKNDKEGENSENL